MIFRFFQLAAVLVFLSSCAARIPYYPPDYTNKVYTVALLPFYNATNDVNGPKSIREEFYKRIQHRHYDIKPLNESDEALLNRMGITLGSQLEMTTAKDVGDALGVDGVLYGYVLDYDDITTGLYNVKKVRAGFKLVDTRTGEVVWSGGLGVKSVLAGGKAGVGVTVFKEASGDGLEPFSAIKGLEDIRGIRHWHVMLAGATKNAGDAAAISLGEKIVSKAFGIYMKAETNVLLNRVMSDFPSGPGGPGYREPEVKPFIHEEDKR